MRVLDLRLKYAPDKNIEKFEVYINVQKFLIKMNLRKYCSSKGEQSRENVQSIFKHSGGE